MLTFRTYLIFFFLFTAGAAKADTRPNPPVKRTYEETVRTMSLGKYVRCSLIKDFLLQTKDGLKTPDNENYAREILFDGLSPEASSPSDFATYSLSWRNEEIRFYFYMNSQAGEIRIFDQKKGLAAETDLDLSDLAKEEPYIGSVRLIQKEDILVTSPKDSKLKVPGERITYLKASCQFLNRYVP